MRKTFCLNSLLAAVLRLPALPALGGLVLLCIVLSVPAQGVMPDADFFKVCKTGTAEEVRQALNSGANIAAQDTQGKTALMFTAESNTKPAVMKELLKAADEFNKKRHWYKRGKKIDINDVNEKGKTALMFAVENNSPEVVQVLLNAGADARIKDKQGMTVMMAYAARDNADPAVMEMLLKAVAEKGIWPFKVDINDSDKEGKTALMYAAKKKCNPDVVRVLLNAGTDIKARDKEGRTALMWAEAEKSCPKVVKLLQDATPLPDDKFLQRCAKGTAEEIRKALEAGANINAKGKDDMTVLMMYAARDNGDPVMMEELLKAADEFNRKGLWKKGKNILGFKTVDVNAVDKKGKTALMFAAEKNSSDVVRVLLKAGAKVNIKDKEDMTALMFAVEEKCNPEVVIELLEAGAVLNAMDKKGKTALTRLKEKKFCQKSTPAVSCTPTSNKPESTPVVLGAPTREDIMQSLRAAAEEWLNN